MTPRLGGRTGVVKPCWHPARSAEWMPGNAAGREARPAARAPASPAERAVKAGWSAAFRENWRCVPGTGGISVSDSFGIPAGKVFYGSVRNG